MKNISVFLVTEGSFQVAVLPKSLLTSLVDSLKIEGKTDVHFADKSILVEGIYIPAKNSKTKMITFSDPEE